MNDTNASTDTSIFICTDGDGGTTTGETPAEAFNTYQSEIDHYPLKDLKFYKATQIAVDLVPAGLED